MKKLLAGLAFLSLIMLPSLASAACTGASISVLQNGGGAYSFDSPTQSSGGCGQPPHQWFMGTSNNGLYASLLTLESTELNALANAGVAVSSVGGTSGLFTNSNTGAAQLGEVFFTSGATATCTAGGNIAIWFLQSGDGTTFETATVAQMIRAPDAVILLPTAAISTNTYKAPGPVNIPALNFKIMAVNNCGATLGATGNLIKLAPIAGQN